VVLKGSAQREEKRERHDFMLVVMEGKETVKKGGKGERGSLINSIHAHPSQIKIHKEKKKGEEKVNAP